MPTTRLFPEMPPAAAILGLAGVIPFAAASLASFAGGAVGGFAQGALLAYGAVILSFLGGIQWGFAVQCGRPDFPHLGISVVPSLVAWAALLSGGAAGLLLLAAAFAGVLAIDLRLTREGTAPAWYPRLRTMLTAAVIACLLPALLGSYQAV